MRRFVLTDRDKGFRRIIKQAHALNAPHHITVGVHGEEGGAAHGGAATIADIATIHEFGLGHVPERSWLRGWVDTDEARNKQIITNLVLSVFRGQNNLTDAMTKVGLLFVAAIQKRITSNIPPPLAEQTIERKGSSVALIDTGIFRSSITHKLEGV